MNGWKCESGEMWQRKKKKQRVGEVNQGHSKIGGGSATNVRGGDIYHFFSLIIFIYS